MISGTIVVRRDGSSRSWDAKNIQLSARLDAAQADHQREWSWRRVVLDHIAITPEVCDDFLKFVAPTLARVARAGGAFSLELDECHLPLAAPRRGDASGRLTIHEMLAGPGPMAEQVAAMFHIPDANQLAHEEVIRFQLRNERVYHEGFALDVGPMNVATQGSVSLEDQSLDIRLAVRLPEFKAENAPIRAALSGQTLTLPIRGTLGHPQIDPQELRKAAWACWPECWSPCPRIARSAPKRFSKVCARASCWAKRQLSRAIPVRRRAPMRPQPRRPVPRSPFWKTFCTSGPSSVSAAEPPPSRLRPSQARPIPMSARRLRRRMFHHHASAPCFAAPVACWTPSASRPANRRRLRHLRKEKLAEQSVQPCRHGFEGIKVGARVSWRVEQPASVHLAKTEWNIAHVGPLPGCSL